MDIREKTINALRVLSAEMIENAGSGHPGVALGAAPIAYTVFDKFLTFDPSAPDWENRDRFVLSAGHGSALLYALLHVYGYDVSTDDLKSFRRGETCPGHPERGKTPGVEVTTGPLGQGVANAVGMAAAEAHLAAIFNRPGFPVVDHRTYVLCGDGCLEEGISYEACSFAGAQRLGKLILLYDSNGITMEGEKNSAFNENVEMRFRSQGWKVFRATEKDMDSIETAIEEAKKDASAPSMIICETTIGYGSDMAGSATVHGTPLGKEGLAHLKERLEWAYSSFVVPDDVIESAKKSTDKKKKEHEKWDELFSEYEKTYPDLAKLYRQYFDGSSQNLDEIAASMTFEKPDSTRNEGGKAFNELFAAAPNFFGGAADLAPSTKARVEGSDYFSAEHREGCNIHFGIREHAMAAICNGAAAHGGLRTFCSTFMIFSDYMKHSMRLSALMNLPVTYILSHDSVGVGEDGATHQPVEQLETFRAIPNLNVFRPADGKETAYSWLYAVKNKEPCVLALSRQSLPQLENTGEGTLKGGYIVEKDEENPDVILIATGSELCLCIEARKILKDAGISSNVVSMPCIELFEKQSKSYKQSVLPDAVSARVCVEAANSPIWYKYARGGAVLGVDDFGVSVSGEEMFKKFGLTAENIAKKAIGVVRES